MSFELGFEVRDYECDLQGIVNNAVYQQYLEHTRHQFIKTRGIDFAQMHAQGVNLVVARAELEYKYSLKSGDAFVVTLRVVQESKLRIVFYQDILLVPDRRLVLHAKITTTSVNGVGKPVYLPELGEALGSLRL